MRARWGLLAMSLLLLLPTAGRAKNDTAGNLVVTPGTLHACEDQDANVCMVRVLSTRTGRLTANTQVSAVPAYVESITISPSDSAPTAGTIVLYDNTAASGTELFHYEVTTTYFQPVTIPIHASAFIGIYLGFTTVADVNVWVNYRAN